MPFITEELWDLTAAEGRTRDGLLILAKWPHLQGLEDTAAEAEIGWVIELITAIRSVRAEMNIQPGALLPLVLVDATAQSRERAQRWSEFIRRLARLSAIDFAAAAPAGSVQLVIRGETAALPLAGLIDIEAERSRLSKEAEKVAADIRRIDAKLGNADFMRRAPEEVVDGEREKRDEAESRRTKLDEALARLNAVGA